MAGLLRLATVGSVDDGKSTLVGRLLHDTRSILADQLAAVERASRDRRLASIDLALLTDGLRAEREQGITIDVAYRYFATRERGFILADTPGHVQYTRNMVTGSSTAQAVIILVDARNGIVEQTLRHTAIAALLRIPHLVLAVNKMDLVGHDPTVFGQISDEFGKHGTELGLQEITAIPLSALKGDNVVHRSREMPWYQGPTLLAHLEALPSHQPPLDQPMRMPVQYVIRPGAGCHSGYRGYAGQIVSGVIRVGEEIVVQPGNVRTRVTAIDGLNGPLVAAFHPMSVTVRIADDLDVTRGDLLADAASPASTTREIVGMVCWLAERTARTRDRVLARVGTRTVLARIDALHYRLDIETMIKEPAQELRLNDLTAVSVRTAEPVAVDDYRDCRGTGAFLLIDPDDGSTLAAGMIGEAVATRDLPLKW